MSDAKHTPGPWKAYGFAIYTKAKRRHWVSGRDARQSLVAHVRDNDDADGENMADNPPCFSEAEANAILIASAPDLLAALEKIADETAATWVTDVARAAIAKAKGQA